MAIITTPSLRQAGSISSIATGSLTVAQPLTVGIDDVLVLVVCTANDIFATWPPTGWTEAPTPPTGFGTAGAAGGLRLFVAWKRATATTGNAVALGNPGATNNYTVGGMYSIQGVARRGDPWEASATSNQTTAATAVSFDSITTLGPQRFIFHCLGGDADVTSAAMVTNTGAGSWVNSNANLVSPTERGDSWTASGVGGGITVGTATKTLAGAIGSSAITLANSQVHSKWVGALRPVESHSRFIVF